MNAIFLQQHLCLATGTTVSIQIVQNRLHAVGLYTTRHRSAGTRNNPPFALGNVRSGAVGVMVYVSADYHFEMELRPVNDLGMRSSDIL